MMELTAVLAAGLLSLAILTVAGAFALKAWNGWLDLRKLELARGGPTNDPAGEPAIGPVTGGRIEIADLRERVRKLEAIAAGIDL
jgi:hypothetical protein